MEMRSYKSMSDKELLTLKEKLNREYEDSRAKGLQLNMARGKPSKEQLDMMMPMLSVLNENSDLNSETQVDCRNYGELLGLKEARQLVGEVLEVPYEQVIVCGNASLPIMYDTVSRSFTFGVNGGTPWCKLDKVKFLCPVPGYDRHFAITETFGIEMILIPMTEEGPDVDLIKKYVENDDTVKGMWCVPKYSNPSGITYSDETVKALAAMKPAAEDFRIYWDNAYAVHDLYEDSHDTLLNILEECKKQGNENMVYEFCSTSKISMAGAGIAAVATSPENVEWFKKYMTIQTIGYDKINQLRHVRYFKNADGIRETMKKHAAVLRPKFTVVLDTLEKELGGLGIADWVKPHGGYFISFDAMDGCAKEIVKKCKEAGLILTGAGSTYPYKKDPKDSNIRIAPSYPTVEEIHDAANLFVLCVKLVSIDRILQERSAK